MAKNKKLNKAIRARMERTGEPFSTARMNILRARGAAMSDHREDLTVIATCEKVITAGNTTRRLRLEPGHAGVQVILDGVDLGEFQAPVEAGKARVPDGEYALSGGWAVRVEGEYEEPMPEFGIDGGWRTGGQVALLPPQQPGREAFGRRLALVWVEFRTDGSVCGWGGTSTPFYRAMFVAPAAAPVKVEVETLPVEGDESQNILDYHRRKVLRVVHAPVAEDVHVLVALGEPLVPEGAWSLASPNFPVR